MAHSVVDVRTKKAKASAWKEQMHETKQKIEWTKRGTKKRVFCGDEQKCRHCFIRAGAVPNEVNLTRCVHHQNRLNSFTELYTVYVRPSLLLLLLLLVFFTSIFPFVVWISDSLAERSVYRLAFNILSSTISSPLFWSAGVDFCVFVPKQTHPMHTHAVPHENETHRRVR